MSIVGVPININVLSMTPLDSHISPDSCVSCLIQFFPCGEKWSGNETVVLYQLEEAQNTLKRRQGTTHTYTEKATGYNFQLATLAPSGTNIDD